MLIFSSKSTPDDIRPSRVIKKQNPTKLTPEQTWADGYQSLIANGHSLNAIFDYTLARFKYFLQACQRREQAFFMQSIVAARLAQADKESFEKAMQELNHG